MKIVLGSVFNNEPFIWWQNDYGEICEILAVRRSSDWIIYSFPYTTVLYTWIYFFFQVERAASEYRAIIPGFTAKDVVLPFTTDGGTSTIHFTTGTFSDLFKYHEFSYFLKVRYQISKKLYSVTYGKYSRNPLHTERLVKQANKQTNPYAKEVII